MSSVLKRLREVSDMRELGLTRREYRHAKWVSSDDRRARAYFKVQGPDEYVTPKEKQRIEEAQARSKLALKQLHSGLRSFVKAVRVYFGKE